MPSFAKLTMLDAQDPIPLKLGNKEIEIPDNAKKSLAASCAKHKVLTEFERGSHDLPVKENPYILTAYFQRAEAIADAIAKKYQQEPSKPRSLLRESLRIDERRVGKEYLGTLIGHINTMMLRGNTAAEAAAENLGIFGVAYCWAQPTKALELFYTLCELEKIPPTVSGYANFPRGTKLICIDPPHTPFPQIPTKSI